MKKLAALTFALIMLAMSLNIPVLAKSASRTYTDEIGGVTFTIPNDWELDDITDKDFNGARFVSTKKQGGIIAYGSKDAWAEMSESEKKGYTRSDLNNSAFTKSNIAEMSKTTVDKVTTVKYNGVKYFKTESDNLNDAGTITCFIYWDYGWIYTFEFFGTSTHELYSDLEDLLESVQYTSASTSASKGNASATDDSVKNDENSGLSFGTRLVLSMVLTAAIYMGIPCLIYVVAFKKPSSLKAIKTLIIITSVVFWIAIRIIEIELTGESTSGAAVFLWSSIAYALLRKINEKAERKVQQDETAAPPAQGTNPPTSTATPTPHINLSWADETPKEDSMSETAYIPPKQETSYQSINLSPADASPYKYNDSSFSGNGVALEQPAPRPPVITNSDTPAPQLSLSSADEPFKKYGDNATPANELMVQKQNLPEEETRNQVYTNSITVLQERLFCRKCGTQLLPDSVYCDKCGTEVSPQGSYCNQCGAILKTSSVFCSNCGTKVEKL